MSSETKSRAGRASEILFPLEVLWRVFQRTSRRAEAEEVKQAIDQVQHRLDATLVKLESSSSADTGGLPTVDEIAEVMADAGLWKGAWKGMCEAERNVTRQRAEGVYAMLVRRSADPGTTGAEELVMKLQEAIDADADWEDRENSVRRILRLATTQRAPVTPPKMMTCGICGKPFPDENGKGFCVCVLD